ncbi:YtoQ family protein [Roseibium alexandrii]|uniref:YtoQ family protein n=2 Tax=Roseibium alexandrii TaxID=388408 RepID=A0A0M6ZRH1_9HYPH|nr:YtoQ family protein [Roseibium alexandrii]
MTPANRFSSFWPTVAAHCPHPSTQKGKIMSEWRVFLSGEIHTDWREQIVSATKAAGLPVSFSAPVTNHEASDDCGAAILGGEDQKFWYDHKGAKVNAIRTRTLIEKADIVVVRFGDKYKQWNAAFDAGYASALGKSLIVLHDPSLTHPLKEVDAAALAVAETPDQVVRILKYAIEGEL